MFFKEMKKTYISPSIITVILSETTMIAISATNVEGLSVDGTTGDSDIKEGAVKSNSYSVWDDVWSDITQGN